MEHSFNKEKLEARLKELEEKSYYTPSIEEFRYGFQFEVYNSPKAFFYAEAAEGWMKTQMTFGVLGNLLNIEKFILDKLIRVKYLDQEDIEAEGWVSLGKKINIYSGFEHYLYVNIDGSISIYEATGNNVNRDENTLIVQSIAIRNRSELNRLMKQLGIE